MKNALAILTFAFASFTAFATTPAPAKAADTAKPAATAAAPAKPAASAPAKK